MYRDNRMLNRVLSVVTATVMGIMSLSFTAGAAEVPDETSLSRYKSSYPGVSENAVYDDGGAAEGDIGYVSAKDMDEKLSPEGDPDPAEPTATPTPVPEPAVLTLRFLDDEAHGSAELVAAVNPAKGIGFKKLLGSSGAESSAAARATVMSIVRHGVKIASWNLYEVRGGERTLVGNFTPSQLKSMANNNKSNPADPYYAINTDCDLVAVWDVTPVKYKINYNLQDGAYFTDADEDNVVEKFDMATPVALYNPVKKGCFFGGWFTDPSFTNPVTSIPAGVEIDSDEEGNLPEYNLYPLWIPASAGRVVVKSAKNTGKGEITLEFDEVLHAIRYEIAFSSNKAFKEKNTSVFNVAASGSAKITNLLKKTYYVKVRAIVMDSVGELASGGWSEVSSVGVLSGVKEVKAKKGKIKLKSVEIKDGQFHLVANAPKRLKSADENYYLVTVDPFSNKIERMVAPLPKTKVIDVSLPVRDEKKKTDLIQGRYGVAVMSKGGKKAKYKLMTQTMYIKNPEDAAGYTGEFPTPLSKKGLQGNLAGNVKHTFMNVDLGTYVAPSKKYGSPYKYNGKTYYFNKGAMTSLAGWARNCNQNGIVCTAQFMLTWPKSGKLKYLVAPEARSKGHSYYTLNGTDQKARQTWEALFSCMAEIMATEDAHLDNWILGNEVNVGNSASGWYYRGGMNKQKFMKHYASVYKTLYYAVRSHSKNSRVYICTDHTFNNDDGDWGAKPFMELFDSDIKKYNKGIKWNLAYHAYPAILTQAATWNDAYTSNSEGSRFVTPKNLNILTDFVKKKFGKDCRIILSEQGFTATGAGNSENVQAAAVAYTYYKAQFNDMIDAVIFRSYTDADVEVAQGLSFGLSNRSKVWSMFTNMDSPKSTNYTEPYLSTIGAGSWSSIIPGWNESRFKEMK